MNVRPILGICLLLFAGIILSSSKSDWGFFGHKRINRLAVFTLPADLIGFYKKNIDYITDHAVDPDKRRYATKHEAVRHYIDIDHWGSYPFPDVPRAWDDVMTAYTDIIVIGNDGDTLRWFNNHPGIIGTEIESCTGSKIPYGEYKYFVKSHVTPSYYEDDRTIDCQKLEKLLPSMKGKCNQAFAVDRFSGYGILPYHLMVMQKRLTKAFEQKNIKSILRYSAEMGHYIGDAHVPLHTTENYNGQLTDQLGIHAFWESRIPELFADDSFDYFVGQAEYIDSPSDYFWQIIFDSHALLDSVLVIEKVLSNNYPPDEQLCFEDRLELTIKTQCRDYAAAYNLAMNGMVEIRMQESIKAIGSSWYTAWIDAGQPNLEGIKNLALDPDEFKEEQKLENAYKNNPIYGRPH